jgi:methylated-DNA-[protein]-cysteine S-methyltransferase
MSVADASGLGRVQERRGLAGWGASFDSPIGVITAVADSDGRLERLQFGRLSDSEFRDDPAAVGPVRDQVDAYFSSDRQGFDLELAPRGTPFQRAVWEGVLTIPYGRTLSYAALAAQIGRPRAQRAVGAANGANPIAIVIPCHRVIGGDGRLTGYGGGVAIKAALLSTADRRTRLIPADTLVLPVAI